ncbi:MAG: hypothetical protein ACI3VB_05795 [Oscillospiraceae bacterium]
MIHFDLTNKEFRRLLDLVYVGNWILNSARGEERFTDYDDVESLIFAQCLQQSGMDQLFDICDGVITPSQAFRDGGIHEAIMDYEDTVFFEILAEELARRDMEFEPIDSSNYNELASRIDEYIAEFEENGVDNITLDK